MINVNNSWRNFLGYEQEQQYYKDLRAFLYNEYKTQTVYPPADCIFKAFELTPLDKIKVVIVGQDVYHTPGMAMGLAFSVNDGQKIPPSLKNIYKEIELEFGKKPPESGNLTRWAEQGVFLLNTTLTVRKGQPMSHVGHGWETFTDSVIRYINHVYRVTPIVFMLWGRHAQSKEELISQQHKVLKAAHPSPFSANKGFFGCNHFKIANEFLEETGRAGIDW